jgi:hypothetical protein
MSFQFHERSSSPKPSRAKEKDDARQRQLLEEQLDEGLDETFPASDAVSIVQPAPGETRNPQQR